MGAGADKERDTDGSAASEALTAELLAASERKLRESYRLLADTKGKATPPPKRP